MNLHVIGAGPAGLAMGYYAKKQKIPLQIFEASDSVGGNCKTLMIANLSSDFEHYEETLTTCRFSTRCAKLENYV